MIDRDDSARPSEALARLLDLERDLLDRLARACSESEGAAERARDEVARAEERYSRDRDEAARALGERLAAEHRTELSRIEDVARREAEAFDRVEATRVDALVEVLVDRLLGWRESPMPGEPAR